MSRTLIRAVITDLDNTLYDWVHAWHKSFKPMLDEIHRISGIERATLLSEIRSIHQLHGTSEYAFLIQEIPSLQRLHSNSEDLLTAFEPAIDAYRNARRENLALYPTVRDTLQRLKSSGTIVVAYTESMAYYTNYRVRKLRLDGLIDYLYSPPDHGLPDGATRQSIRSYSPDSYRFKYTVHRETPEGSTKPNPAILARIIDDLGLDRTEVIYVGDSLMKDIAMAASCGVIGCHAAYGAAQHREEYELLRSVSHWSPKAVEDEKQTIERKEVHADYVLDTCFCELLLHFDFAGSSKPPESSSDPDTGHVIDMWKTTVSVQQHFNDIEMRVRNFALTLLTAMLAAAAVAMRERAVVVLPWFTTSLATTLLGLAAIGWLGFYFVDQVWYHRLLVGAVRYGERLERFIDARYSLGGLTQAISEASPYRVGSWRIHSRHKIAIFYGLILGLVLLFAAAGHVAVQGDIDATGASQEQTEAPP